jgi:hypothetical protein
MCAWTRKHAVEKKLNKFKGCGVGSHVAREADAITTNCDVGGIRIILFWMHFAYHHGVADFLLCMEWDVMVVNKEEGISVHNPFCVGRRTLAYLGIAVQVDWRKTCPRWLCSGGHNGAGNLGGICQWWGQAPKELLDRSDVSMLDRGMQTCHSLQAAWHCRALQNRLVQ